MFIGRVIGFRRCVEGMYMVYEGYTYGNKGVRRVHEGYNMMGSHYVLLSVRKNTYLRTLPLVLLMSFSSWPMMMELVNSERYT